MILNLFRANELVDIESHFFEAAISGDIDSAVEILNLVKNIDIVDKFHRSVIHVAVEHGHKSFVQGLARYRPNVNIADVGGWTPLMIAAFHSKTDFIALLISMGANIDAKLKSGSTALHIASAEEGDKKMCEELVAHGANVNTKNNEGWTPFLLALDGGHYSIARFFLENGADLATRSSDGKNALHFVLDNFLPIDDEIGLAKQIVELGGDVHAKSKLGFTPLFSAVIKNKLEIAEYLLQKGAQVNETAGDGWTPLHYAANHNHLNMVKLLLRHGALLDAKTVKHKKSAADVAMGKRYLELAAFLNSDAAQDLSLSNITSTSKEEL